MEILRYVLMGIYAVVCLALIVLVMKQNKEDGGASGTIVGASANNFYEKNKGKTTEGRIKTATLVLMVVFAVLSITLGIVYVV